MNRRNWLKSAVAIPVAAALSSCKHEPEPSKGSQGTLKVILNGPFGVVLKSAANYRITAYVPSDPAAEHELRFQGPMEVAGKETKNGKSPYYEFKLLERGLDIGQGSPRVDQGFHDFNFPHIGDFQLPKDPFVAIDLPRPDYITFTPPAQPFFFGGKVTFQPPDHILEYRMTEPDRVRIKQGDKEVQPPHCSELLKEYEEFASQVGSQYSNAGDSQLGNIEEMLRNCSPSDRCVLFGVGFNPDNTRTTLEEHGIKFFNEVLLPSFAPNVKKRLQKANCTPVVGAESSHPEIIPAVFRYPTSQPHFLQVSSVLECKVGGLLGTSP